MTGIRLRMPTVGVRASIGLLVGALTLGAAVGDGLASERHQLPVAVSQLKAAVDASADALTCFQGVQDDLFIDTRSDFNAASVAAAQRRLATCTVPQAVSTAARLTVPAAPPIEPGLWRNIRADVVAGQADVHRGALDIESTLKAMTADLENHSDGANVVLTYNAAYSDYEQAGQVEANAAALLRHMGITPPSTTLTG